MILRLLKGRGMVSGLFEKKRDAIPPHPAPPQALVADYYYYDQHHYHEMCFVSRILHKNAAFGCVT
jgi:hypothetical protein